MKSVIITGASSGIGKELAFEFARNGFNLGLIARRFELLQEIREEIKQLKNFSGKIEIAALDVKDYKSVFITLKDLASRLGGISHLIANAGIAGSKPIGTNNFTHDKEVIEVNVIGAMACFEAGIQIFESQNSFGHLIGISSIAGFRGFPSNSSYSASKAAFTTYLEAARIDVAKKNILVTAILPGFIDTPINSEMKNRPFLISAEVGAKKIYKVIIKKKEFAIVPYYPWIIVSFFMKIIPNFIWKRLKFD